MIDFSDDDFEILQKRNPFLKSSELAYSLVLLLGPFSAFEARAVAAYESEDLTCRRELANFIDRNDFSLTGKQRARQNLFYNMLYFDDMLDWDSYNAISESVSQAGAEGDAIERVLKSYI